MNAALKSSGEYLGIDMRQHCVYHPASAGAVESTLKTNLSNVVKKHGQKKALPIVLMDKMEQE